MRKKAVSLAVFVLALGYSAVTGPFRGADEPNHFFRAYQISEGRFLAHHGPHGIVGDELPKSLIGVAVAAGEFPEMPLIKTPNEEFSVGLSVHLEPGRRVLTNFPGSALYSPVIYLPHALGIATGRLVSDRPLVLFYFARLFGVLAGASLLVFAIHRLPPAAEALSVFALIPMVQFQLGIVTADALTLGLAFLWLAEILRLRASGETIGRRTGIGLFVLALCLSQLRSPLLALAACAIPAESFANKNRRRWFLSGLMLAVLLPYLAWSAVVPALFSQMRPGVTTDPEAQLALFIHAPHHFVQAMVADVSQLGLQHLHEAFGIFGWLNFPLPWPLVIAVILAITTAVCSIFPSELRLNWRIRILYSALAVVGFIAAEFAIYSMWNSVGGARVEGFQGRYLLPFLPFLLVALANDRLRKIPGVIEAAFTICIVANLIALGLLAHATFF